MSGVSPSGGSSAQPLLVDTHCHLQDPRFKADRDAVVQRSVKSLAALVCVGYDLESSRRAVTLAAQQENIFATVGIHPNSSGASNDAEWAEIEALARSPKVVGLGETGLDNYRDRTPPAIQERWLRRHLELANASGLPVVIHNRQADQQLRAVLREWRSRAPGWQRPPGVMHCFAADRLMLEAGLELGFYISIAGPVTFQNAEALREVAITVPLGRLVVETDAPYLTPHPFRGQRNEPAYVEYTARRLAELRGERFEQLAAATTRNAAELFGLTIPSLQGAHTL